MSEPARDGDGDDAPGEGKAERLLRAWGRAARDLPDLDSPARLHHDERLGIPAALAPEGSLERLRARLDAAMEEDAASARRGAARARFSLRTYAAAALVLIAAAVAAIVMTQSGPGDAGEPRLVPVLASVTPSRFPMPMRGGSSGDAFRADDRVYVHFDSDSKGVAFAAAVGTDGSLALAGGAPIPIDPERTHTIGPVPLAGTTGEIVILASAGPVDAAAVERALAEARIALAGASSRGPDRLEALRSSLERALPGVAAHALRLTLTNE